MTTQLQKTDQLDLFVADIIDVSPKSDMYSMEFPLFALSSRPDSETFRYDHPTNGNWLEIIPSKHGRPTIHDKDILLYCFGHIADAMNKGKDVSRRIKFIAHDFLVSTHRNTDGNSYKAIGNALVRLRGMTFRTNIINPNNKNKSTDVLGLIDEGRAISDEDGRMLSIEIVLSEHLFNSITNRQILTYNPNYFKLTSAYDRRMYEICRKHCGFQSFWEINLDTLYLKFGVKSKLKEFKRKIKEIDKAQNIPDYLVFLEEGDKKGSVDKVSVRRKTALQKDIDGH